MNTRVGIIIPTINRPEFVIRQLRYYADVNSNHTVYIGDSSVSKKTEKIKDEIKRLENKIKVVYNYVPEMNDRQCIQYLASTVEEKYVTYIGDDDFQIPNSLTKCAQFLEKNEDYATAHGHAVAVRVKDGKCYGEITKIKDYPQPQYEQDDAGDRLLAYLQNYYVTQFSVHRTKLMQTDYEHIDIIKDRGFAVEILPCSLSIIHGKSKLIDCLSFVRQIHDHHYEMPNSFNWLTKDDWPDSYKKFEQKLVDELNGDDKQKRKIIRQGFWASLQKNLAQEYNQIYNGETNLPKAGDIKTEIFKKLPGLKKIYNRLKPIIKKNLPLHFEVIRPGSKYYEDFKAVTNIINPDKKI